MASLTTPPDEVVSGRVKDEEYVAWRAATDLRAPYRVAPEFLQDTKRDAAFDEDEVPLIVFINARSGGRVGPELASVLARALGRSQVFDVAHHRPDTVLRKIWANFEEQERMGNARATHVRQRLRIMACGGDGTVAWILKVIQQLNLEPHPAVAIMPLGTGNDLSRSFKWGSEFDWSWIKGHASVYSTLKRVADAEASHLDCWRLRLLLPNGTYKPGHTYALSEEATSEQQQLAALTGSEPGSQPVLMEGLFWNYFSVGADAQAAYNFHQLRDTHPQLAPNRAANKVWYSVFSCTSGWFCGTLPSVSTFTDIEVLQPGSTSWSLLHIPASIKALVLVNLQSYAGGRNIWGTENTDKKWRRPGVADGLIEVVGFTHGYHAAAVMGSGAKIVHGVRLAQVAGIRLALHTPTPQPDGGPGQVFMQLDGEPWMQHVPASSGAARVVLEVVHAGVSKVLYNMAEPISHPEKKVTKMIGDKQAAAYLAASADQHSDPNDVEQKQMPHSDDSGFDSAFEQEAAARALEEARQASLQRPKAASCAGAVSVPEVPACSSCSDPGATPTSEPASLDGGVYKSQQPAVLDSPNQMLAGGQYYRVVPSAVAVIETGGPVKPSLMQGNSGTGASVTAV